MHDPNEIERERNLKTLRPRKHEIDFFIADEVELSGFRDEMASMEHPFFALKGGGDKVREYVSGNVILTVRPSVGIGLATVFDKDIWIYAISKLQEAINNGEGTSREVYFTPYDFFVTTNRDKGGKSYKELEKGLDRLKGTTIKTNILYSEQKNELAGFGLIDDWKLNVEKKGKLDIGMVMIRLPEWLYQALQKKKILKISPDYFRIRKAIDRRIYEIARKHCGNQGKFQISLEKLHLKTGSSALLKMFRHNIKQLAQTNDLPDYTVSYDKEADSVTFKNRQYCPKKEQDSKNRTEKNKVISHIQSGSPLPRKMQKRIDAITKGGE